MNSVEEFRDYVVADMIHQIQSMTHEELVQAMIHICSPTLEQMDVNELFEFRGRYTELWERK